MKKSLILFFVVALLPTYQALFADGGSITSNRYSNSLTGSAGPTGPAGSTGPAGPTGPSGALSSAYGQLYFSSSQGINISMANTWVAIPFSAFSPSSNVTGSTTPPATMTIVDGGLYQVNVSLYFSSEDSSEGPFTQATYTLGISVDGGSPPVASAAVYAGAPGAFSLNYTTIERFSAADSIQFYIEASAVGGGAGFTNVVTMLGGNATLVLIAN